MIEPSHLRELIKITLDEFQRVVDQYKKGFNTESAIELLCLTAAVESNCGRYLKQLSGPAKGIFQIEPNTWYDLYNRYVLRNKELHYAVDDFDTYTTSDITMLGNLPLQIIMARLIYYQHPEPLPEANDIEGLAKYWKKYYNTYKGKGTIEKAIIKYLTYFKED